jgi:hypothetical protein
MRACGWRVAGMDASGAGVVSRTTNKNAKSISFCAWDAGVAEILVGNSELLNQIAQICAPRE